jgi:hypothetical protein
MPMRCRLSPAVRLFLYKENLMTNIQLNDVRAANSNSWGLVPRVSTVAELQKFMPFVILRDQGWDRAKEGEWVLALVELELRDGAASYIAYARDKDGKNLYNIEMARWWPGAPGSKPLSPNYAPDRFNSAVIGKTDGNKASVGFPYGGGDAAGVGQPGVGYVWPLLSQGFSHADGLGKLAWVAGTNHLNVNGVWKLVQKTNNVPSSPTFPSPNPGPAPGVSYLEIVIDGKRVGQIPVSKIANL